MDRYIRNTQIIGAEGQQRLRQSRVLIVGCGALGSVVAMYLAGAGVGTIALVDFDNVDITNLQRQLSFTESDIGWGKAATLADKLRAINSEIDVIAHTERVTADNICDLMAGCDVVVEASDNPATMYLVFDSAERLGIPYVAGGVAQTVGQVMSWSPEGDCARYADLFPEAGEYRSAAQGGVLGPVPGIVGSIQAAEAIKILAGVGTPLYNRLLTFDGLTMRFSVVEIM